MSAVSAGGSGRCDNIDPVDLFERSLTTVNIILNTKEKAVTQFNINISYL
jgi:hypothetical protein